jgi:hypothetical protein
VCTCFAHFLIYSTDEHTPASVKRPKGEKKVVLVKKFEPKKETKKRNRQSDEDDGDNGGGVAIAAAIKPPSAVKKTHVVSKANPVEWDIETVT